MAVQPGQQAVGVIGCPLKEVDSPGPVQHGAPIDHVASQAPNPIDSQRQEGGMALQLPGDGGIAAGSVDAGLPFPLQEQPARHPRARQRRRGRGARETGANQDYIGLGRKT